MTKNISEEDLLLHIESIDVCQSVRENDRQDVVDSLFLHAESIGLFTSSGSQGNTNCVIGPEEPCTVEWVAEHENDLEVLWASAYEEWRILSKQKWQAVGNLKADKEAGYSATNVHWSLALPKLLRS